VPEISETVCPVHFRASPAGHRRSSPRSCTFSVFLRYTEHCATASHYDVPAVSSAESPCTQNHLSIALSTNYRHTRDESINPIQLIHMFTIHIYLFARYRHRYKLHITSIGSIQTNTGPLQDTYTLPPSKAVDNHITEQEVKVI